MVKFISYIAVAYLAFVFVIYVMQNSFIYFPDKSMPNKGFAPWMEDISVTTKDGLRLSAWWAAPPREENLVIVFFHGNAGNIQNRADKARLFYGRGHGILLAEYRGYGGNKGRPNEKGLYEDGHAYIRWLLEMKNIKENQIVLYGESLGTGVAVEMAQHYPNIHSVVLETPFLSLLFMAQHRFPFIPFMNFLLKDHYRNDLKINSFDAPVLFGIAGKDYTVPAKFAKQLYELRKEPKQKKIYEEAGHNFLFNYGFGEDILEFLSAQ